MVGTQARLISLPEIVDRRGRLVFGEESRHVPFAIKRFFTIHDVPENTCRADHAHRRQEQFIIVLLGKCRVVIKDGAGERTEFLESPTQGVYIPPLTWITLDAFSRGAVCLVLCSDLYDEAEYIRDFSEFETLIQR